MKKEILNLINASKKIIIHRHLRPDMDAIGSQYGLYLLLKENYHDKELYVVGDLNDMSYLATMDDIDDNMYEDALAIITDVSVSKLISDNRYTKAKKLIIIDHHRNDSDLNNIDIFYRDYTFSSASEMIVDLAKTFKWKITEEAATYLYGGMVTDTGRFLYLTNPSKTFELASYVSKYNPEIQKFYDYLYTEPLAKRIAKQAFSTFETTKHNVAYRMNTKEILSKTNLDFQSVSRGMVNQMAGIKEIPIWASFTEDSESNTVVAELRSRGITIVDIAKKYGGGGHNNACGATLKDFDEARKLLNDLDERVKENDKNTK